MGQLVPLLGEVWQGGSVWGHGAGLVSAMGLSSYLGPLGLQALLEKVLEQLGDVDISPWRCSPCARCGIPPQVPSAALLVLHQSNCEHEVRFHQHKYKKCGKKVWGEGGFHHQLSHCEGVPLLKTVKCLYVPPVAARGRRRSWCCSSAWACLPRLCPGRPRVSF